MNLSDPYSLVLGGTAVIAAAQAAYGWRNRPTPGATSFTVLLVGVTVWTAGHAFGLASTDRASYVFWTNVQWTGVVLVPTAWLLFTLGYMGRDRWLTRRTVAALAVVPAVTLVAVWTNQFHPLFSLDATAPLDPRGPASGLATAYGPLYWLAVGYFDLVLLAATGIVVQSMLSAPRLYRARNLALLVAVLAPLTGLAVDVLGVPRFGTAITPFALIVSGLVLAWAVFTRRLFGVLPVTPAVVRDVVFEETNDGLVIVDASDRVVEWNPAASRVAREEPVRGDDISTAFPPIADLLESTPVDEKAREQRTVAEAGRERYIEVRVTPIRRRADQLLGRLVSVRDINDRRIHEQRLDVLNRVLRHNVRNEMTVILGHNEELRESVADAGVLDHVESVERAGKQLLAWTERAQQVEDAVGRDATAGRPLDIVAEAQAAVAAVRDRNPYASVFQYVPESAWVVADPSIGDAVTELVENAIKHNDRARPRVRLTVDVADEWVELGVADDGPGIPRDERAALVRGRETPLSHTSGLGLWHVNWLVRAAGGTVEFDENEPRGSAVRIRLPRATDRE